MGDVSRVDKKNLQHVHCVRMGDVSQGYSVPYLILAEESVQSAAELREVLAVRLDRVVDVVLNEVSYWGWMIGLSHFKMLSRFSNIALK